MIEKAPSYVLLIIRCWIVARYVMEDLASSHPSLFVVWHDIPSFLPPFLLAWASFLTNQYSVCLACGHVQQRTAHSHTLHRSRVVLQPSLALLENRDLCTKILFEIESKNPNYSSSRVESSLENLTYSRKEIGRRYLFECLIQFNS